MRKAAFFIAWLIAGCPAIATAQPAFHPSHHRILFILDASGSMSGKWGESTRFDVAKATLFSLVDSLEKANPDIRFALRVFGAQFPRTQKNCSDSKLFVPFEKNNAGAFRRALNNINPQGMTPVAFSIMEGAKDFPADSNALNAIILITDGNENCEGDPCASAGLLAEKRISLKPFIVGVDVAEGVEERFKCVGTFLNSRTSADLKNAVGVIIRQTLNSTTVQVNLLDRDNNPTVTNIPFTFYDHYSHRTLYNFIHTQRSAGISDTIFLDPTGVYDLTVHTTPPVFKKEISLSVGRNNVIAVAAPLKWIRVLTPLSASLKNDAQVIVRNDEGVAGFQDRNKTLDYLSDSYTIQTLTRPVHERKTPLPALGEEVDVEMYGTLLLSTKENCRAAILKAEGAREKQADHLLSNSTAVSLKLQPGNYNVLLQPLNSNKSEQTKTVLVIIEEGKTSVLDL